MPGRSKTSSTVIAALVMAAAATATSLWSPPDPAGTTTDAAAPVAATASPQPSAGARQGRPGGLAADERVPGVSSPDLAPHPAVLFVGRSAALTPRGGSTASFACRAAVSLSWACVVRPGASPTIPASVTADTVVVVMAPSDDAVRVGRLLDRLPAGLSGARTLIVGPIAATSDASAGRRLTDVRRLASARGAVVVDPVAGRWVTSRTAATYLVKGGDQLTAAGHAHVATRLSSALKALAAH